MKYEIGQMFDEYHATTYVNTWTITEQTDSGWHIKKFPYDTGIVASNAMMDSWINNKVMRYKGMNKTKNELPEDLFKI